MCRITGCLELAVCIKISAIKEIEVRALVVIILHWTSAHLLEFSNLIFDTFC